MNFDNSFSLEQMMKAAQAEMSAIGQRLNAIDVMVNDHLGGHSRMSLLGAVIASAAWAAAFLFAYYRYGDRIPAPFGLLLLIVSLALVVFVMIGDFVQLKYYGVIFRAQNRLARLRGRLTMGQNALSNNLKVFQGRRSAQWEFPLEPGPSIDQEIGRIESQLSSLKVLSSGSIVRIRLFLYYAVCAAWAAAGSYALFDIVGSALGGLAHGIMMVALVVACILEIVIAELIWDTTDNDVDNRTLLAIFAGPVTFAILCACVALVIVVVRIVFYIVAIAIGIACVFGSLSGG